MYRKLRGGFASDEGISILEVVMAAFILFFVLTAVLGLVATTTRMGLSARQRTAMNNAVESHLEWLRSLEFDQLAITGTSTDAAVDSQTVVMVDGFTVTITTEISDGTGATRNVRVNATATANDFRPMTTAISSVIRDSDSVTTMVEAGEGPEVLYISPSAAADAVVYGSQVLGATYQPLYVAVRATASEDDGVIADLRMYCSDTLLRNGTTIFADVAAWQPGTHSVDQSFRWNTRQVDDDGEEAIEDGWRIVRALATDQTGAQGLAERRFYVDNYPPGDPGIPTAQVNTDIQTRVSWSHALDGSDYAPSYVVRWAREGTTGALGSLNTVSGLTSNVFMHATESFSRYTVSVAASNYRGDTTSYIEIAKPYVSRTALTGQSTTSFSGNGNNKRAYTTVSLQAGAPTFPVSGIRYDVYRVNATTLGISSYPPSADQVEALAVWETALSSGIKSTSVYASNVSPTYTDTFDKKVGSQGSPDPWFYAFKVTFTPSGYAGGQSEELWSDIVGPIKLTAGTGSMVHAAW